MIQISPRSFLGQDGRSLHKQKQLWKKRKKVIWLYLLACHDMQSKRICLQKDCVEVGANNSMNIYSTMILAFFRGEKCWREVLLHFRYWR